MDHSIDPPIEIANPQARGGSLGSTLDCEGEMELPNRSVTITLQGVCYSVKDTRKGPSKGQKLNLLSNVTAFFEPGQLNALMGPSGSGKTTLLDVLAGRKTAGTLEGEILFSGIKPTQQYLRRYTGYTEQFDTLLPILTPFEMLMYTAELKRPLREPLSRKKEAVEELLKMLALDVCRNVKIGSPLSRGISGGQAKRTNIGISLITNPRVLFLDEPTTGLDSYTSNEVMTMVQKVARSGVTVVATIHSPTAYAFSLFDTLLMLVQGRTVYFGPQGPAALTFFQESCPNVKPFDPKYNNDAEYLVDLVTEADRVGKGGEYADVYAKSSLARSCEQKVSDLVSATQGTVPPDLLKELQVSRATVTPSWWAMAMFAKYRTSKHYRDPAFLAPRIMDKMLIALLVMTLYLNVGKKIEPAYVIDISAVLFMWSATTGFIASGYIPTLVLERALFLRERSDGLYTTLTYLIAKMIDELMINFVATCGICAFVFYGIQLQGAFILFWLNFFTAVSTGIILAYFVAAISPNLDVANALLPTYAVTLMFFAGFLIRLKDIPPWWYWYSVLDFSRYSFGASMINQFEDHDIIYLNGQTVLEYYGFDGVKSKWTYTGFTALFFIFFFCCAWLTLSFKKYTTR